MVENSLGGSRGMGKDAKVSRITGEILRGRRDPEQPTCNWGKTEGKKLNGTRKHQENV